MSITEKTLAAMFKHAEDDYPNEACGLIVMKGEEEVYFPCKNIAKDRTEQFRICPHDFVDAEDVGEVVGVFHSHPDGTSTPSAHDMACMSVNAEIQLKISPDSTPPPWHIVSWPEGDYRVVEPVVHSSILGRPFIHGLWDCWQACNDYYEKYHNLKFPRYEREDAWWEVKDGPSHYEDLFESAGFYDVTGEDLQVGDMIIMQIGRSFHPNHAGIYLGKVSEFEGVGIGGPGPFMLHHMYDKESEVIVFGGQWQQRTRMVLRHKEI